MENYFADEDFVGSPLDEGEYEQCIFSKIDMAGKNITKYVFIDCEFIDCDLSNANLSGTAFRNVQFKNCKLLGLRFDSCDPFLFEVHFYSCQLDHASFHKCSMKEATFENSSARNVDFTSAILSGARFRDTNLEGAAFENTDLSESDLSGAVNFIILPSINNIKNARFSLEGLPGLLTEYNIKID